MAYPSETFWWKDGEQVREYSDMATQWPSTAAASPVIGFALDGYPIFGPYDESGVLQRGLDFGGDLDECNGKTDSNGNYGYYLTVDPPFAPPCLKGEKGVFSYHTTEKMCPKDGFDTRVLDTSSEACAGISFAEALTCGEEVVTADIGDDNSGVAYAGFTLALAMGVAVALLDVLAQV